MAQTFTHHLNISGPTGAYTFEIPVEETVLGRQPGVGLQLENETVSRRHARLDCSEESCAITDLKSSNGTKVNDVKIPSDEPVPLNDGDMIEIGPFSLVFQQIPVDIPAEPEIEEAVDVVPATLPEAVAVAEPVEEEWPEEPVAPPVPPAPPPPPSIVAPIEEPEPPYMPPPGLSVENGRYLHYLPPIYHTPFMQRFLALFESIYAPIEWNVDNFDLYLNPQTAPADFLPWLANWFDIIFDHSWREDQQRTFLNEAHKIYARRGTKWALGRVLEIYTGQKPTIDDESDDLEPFTFVVKLPLRKKEVNQPLVEQLINLHKPAHTTYKLKFKK